MFFIQYEVSELLVFSLSGGVISLSLWIYCFTVWMKNSVEPSQLASLSLWIHCFTVWMKNSVEPAQLASLSLWIHCVDEKQCKS